MMNAAGESPDGLRLRGLIMVLWRAGLRISEALALVETDLDQSRGAVLVRSGKGGKRREVGMQRWAWEQLEPWFEHRATVPVGALFCVLRGPARGRPCAPAGVRAQLRNVARIAGVRRRFAPHQHRHAHAVERSREGIPARDPAPTRTRRYRDHLGVSARDRQHRNHPRRPRTTHTHDPGERQAHTQKFNKAIPAPCDRQTKAIARSPAGHRWTRARSSPKCSLRREAAGRRKGSCGSGRSGRDS